jgi:hypothetical protein
MTHRLRGFTCRTIRLAGSFVGASFDQTSALIARKK